MAKEPLTAHIDAFLDHLSLARRYSAHTVVAYRNDLYTFADFLETGLEIGDFKEVRRTHISSFMALLSERGLKPRTINRKLSAIQAFYEHGMRHMGWEQNPARRVTRPKMPQSLPTVVRGEAIEELFGGDDVFSDDFDGLRDRLMLGLLYGCGLRRDELVQLRVDSIDVHQRQIKVMGKRSKERLIPVGPALLNQVEAYLIAREPLAGEGPWLFVRSNGKKLSAALVYAKVKFYLSEVTTMEKRSPHVLRHTFATHLLDEGANLQSIKELLGHTSLAATQVYTHTSLEKLKDVYNKSHPKSKSRDK